EKQKGADGIIELMKCGRGDENYFKSIENLLGINRENFNEKFINYCLTEAKMEVSTMPKHYFYISRKNKLLFYE
ncbi:MAG: hypothetical protein LBG77_07060, partial [Dysgonamonadaceae bacterium]|nr:hypothetical protein [Dysgonamonadaceae bacterium]